MPEPESSDLPEVKPRALAQDAGNGPGAGADAPPSSRSRTSERATARAALAASVADARASAGPNARVRGPMTGDGPVVYRRTGASTGRFIRAYYTTFRVIFSYVWLGFGSRIFGQGWRAERIVDAAIAESVSEAAFPRKPR